MKSSILVIIALANKTIFGCSLALTLLKSKPYRSIHSLGNLLPCKVFSSNRKHIISEKASKVLREIYRKEVPHEHNLTSFRGEYKAIIPANLAGLKTLSLEKLVLDLGGTINLRDGTPEHGFNVTSTVLGGQYIVKDGESPGDTFSIRFRKYGQIDHSNQLSNQTETNELSWFEIKTKLLPESNKHRNITLKSRMIVPDYLIFRYLSAVQHSNSCVISSIHALCDWAKENAKNSISDIHIIEETLKILHYDKQDVSAHALMCVTRRANQFKIPNFGDLDNFFEVQETEDRNLAIFSGNIMDFWGPGYLNPAYFYFFKPKFSLPDSTRFLEIKMKDYDSTIHGPEAKEFTDVVLNEFTHKMGKKSLLRKIKKEI